MCKSKTLETWNTHTGQSRDKGGQKTGINLEVDIFMLGGREKVRRRDFGRKWRKLEKTNVGNGLGDIQVAGMAGLQLTGKIMGHINIVISLHSGKYQMDYGFYMDAITQDV